MVSITDRDTPDTERGEQGARDDWLDTQDVRALPGHGRVRSRIRQAPHRSGAPYIGALAWLLIALTVGYAVVFVLPTLARERQSAALQAETAKREWEREQGRQLAGCLRTAFEDYTAGWDFACQQRGVEMDCFLPVSRAEALNRTYLERQELCVKKYK